MLLSDCVAIINEGHKDFGRAIALKFAEAGCSIVFVDMNRALPGRR